MDKSSHGRNRIIRDMDKTTANEILGVFERYQKSKCSRDRALEDITKIIENYALTRPIVGYVTSGALRGVIGEVLLNKKQNEDKNYMYDVQIHRDEISLLERVAQRNNF